MLMKLRKWMRPVSMYFRQRKRKALLKKEFYGNAQSGRAFLLPEQSEQILRELHARIAVVEMPVTGRRYVVLLRIAAAAFVLLVAGTIWLYHPSASHTQETTPVAAVKKDNIRVHANNTQEVKDLLLSDKSIVRLLPGSSVSYYASYDTGGSRNISLSGKAFFEVAKDPLRPFTVYAADISTTALGTVFMVSTEEPGKVQVKLFEGKVAIRSAGEIAMQEVRLRAGEQFIIDKESKKFTVTSFKDSLAAGNKKVLTPANNGILEFQQEPLANVLARIGKRYNVQFVYGENDDFRNMLVTGKFLPSDSLHVVLSMLGTINKLSFKEHNGKIEVTGRQ